MAQLARIQAEKLAAKLTKKYGLKAGSTADTQWPFEPISTGILALDYALGTKGWVPGHPVEVMGPPDIGKSSVLGLNAIRSAQRMGKACAVVALEPGFDPKWAEKNGVDTSSLVIARPDHGLEAFNMLNDCIDEGIEFVLFDSIGAVLRESAVQKDGKPSPGGSAALISWGVTSVLMKCWKRGATPMFINQVRDKMGSPIPGQVESPGGWALKHSCAVRIQLKQAGSAYTAKVEGDEKPSEIGRKLVAIVIRNKLSEGSKRRAEFDWYGKETDESNVGVDRVEDIINTAMRTGVIKGAGAYYRHPAFGEKGQFQGRDPIGPFLAEHPEVEEQIRKEVFAVMERKFGQPLNTTPSFELIEDDDEAVA